MRVSLGLLALVATCLAYDAVIFSNDQELSRDHPSIDALVNGASDVHPLVFLVEPDFTLGQFSRQAGAYVGADKQKSALTNAVRSSKHNAQRYMDVSVHVPNAVVITSAEEFKAGAPVYIIAAEDWTLLEQLASSVLPKISGYTGILANTEAVSQQAARVKRLSSDLIDEADAAPAQQKQPVQRDAANGVDIALPLTLPAFNRTGVTAKPDQTCLLYMEGLNIVVSNKKGEVPTAWPSAGATIINGTFKASDDNVQCIGANKTMGTTVFKISVNPTGDVLGHNVEGLQFKVANQPIEFQLTFNSDKLGYWNLQKIELLSDVVVDKVDGGKGSVVTKQVTAKAKTDAMGLSYMGINAVLGYGFNCGDTPAAFFKTDSEQHVIGISFHNFQVALGGVDASKGFYFNTQVGDCVGTFSTGSLMGIITSLVLMTVFIFGFLMLNSVQTCDRFDDPKQKQILINVRE